MMPLQRACGAESQVRNKLSNGPLRAQSKVISPSILRREAYVSCRGYAGIPQAHSVTAVNQGGTADKYYSSLTELYSSVRDFLFLRTREDSKMFLLVKRWRG